MKISLKEHFLKPKAVTSLKKNINHHNPLSKLSSPLKSANNMPQIFFTNQSNLPFSFTNMRQTPWRFAWVLQLPSY